MMANFTHTPRVFTDIVDRGPTVFSLLHCRNGGRTAPLGNKLVLNVSWLMFPDFVTGVVWDKFGFFVIECFLLVLLCFYVLCDLVND